MHLSSIICVIWGVLYCGLGVLITVDVLSLALTLHVALNIWQLSVHTRLNDLYVYLWVSQWGECVLWWRKMNSLTLKANYTNAPDARPLEASPLPRGVQKNQSQLAYITTSAHSTACESHTFIYLFALMPLKLNTGCAQYTKGHCNLPVKMNAGLRATSVWVVIKSTWNQHQPCLSCMSCSCYVDF